MEYAVSFYPNLFSLYHIVSSKCSIRCKLDENALLLDPRVQCCSHIKLENLLENLDADWITELWDDHKMHVQNYKAQGSADIVTVASVNLFNWLLLLLSLIH